MNIYVVIEGESACKKIYKNWIPLVNSNLVNIDNIREFTSNNFLIIAGHGQPNIMGVIENSIEDVNSNQIIDRLVIGMDSEEAEYNTKLAELQNKVNNIGCRVEVKYIIQHFCIETWLLGNKAIIRRNPTDLELLKYINLYNVRTNDPELLPNLLDDCRTRSQFAYKYIRAGIRDKLNGRYMYSKRNPGIACSEGYFSHIKNRYEITGHIMSFSDFIAAFS